MMRENLYLFKYLLASNVLLYMETGAVPAMLLALSQSFGMTYAEQGILGGVVYLSLGIGGPLAGYALRRFHHKYVLLVALYSNLLLTLCWALTPTQYGGYSILLFIALRALMGIFQSVICVFLPLWTNENAPKKQRTSYMSYLQVRPHSLKSLLHILPDRALLSIGLRTSWSHARLHIINSNFIIITRKRTVLPYAGVEMAFPHPNSAPHATLHRLVLCA